MVGFGVQGFAVGDGVDVGFTPAVGVAVVGFTVALGFGLLVAFCVPVGVGVGDGVGEGEVPVVASGVSVGLADTAGSVVCRGVWVGSAVATLPPYFSNNSARVTRSSHSFASFWY